MLAHGVIILGVTFAPEPDPPADEMPTLNVTLLVDTDSPEALAVDTSLLSSRNQAGTGDDEGNRPTRTLTASHPLNQQGEPLGVDDLDAEALSADTPPDRLISRNRSNEQIEAVPETTDSPSPVPKTAAALLQQESPETLAAEIGDEVSNAQSDDADVAAPSTRESALAAYMVGWRQRVERVASANFPAEARARGQAIGRPMLEVSIGADGEISEALLLRSSGSPVLDQAALRSLELAAPFEPLPEAILAEADVLRFAYEWEFSGGAR